MHSAAACPQPPDIDPKRFVSRVDNPFFALVPGTIYVYRGREDGEAKRKVVEVTAGTKVIQGVTTTVVADKVYLVGKLVEDTKDWYAQDDRGTVWYFGEDTKQIEDGQVASTEGSFVAGVGGARAGVFTPAHARRGQVLAAEYAKDVAEDCYRILEVDGRVQSPFASSRHALVREEFSRLDPGCSSASPSRGVSEPCAKR